MEKGQEWRITSGKQRFRFCSWFLCDSQVTKGVVFVWNAGRGGNDVEQVSLMMTSNYEMLHSVLHTKQTEASGKYKASPLYKKIWNS